jgi:hypothetical protein
MLRLLFWVVLLLLIAVACLLWMLLRPTLFARRVERALRTFVRDRAALESSFFEKASASGKPRGLAWKTCAFQNGVLLARDRANGEIVALMGVTVGFEALQGGGMEDVEAVGNLRAATALFTWNGGEWTTAGRAVFNLEPREVIERYRANLDPVAIDA